MTTDELNALNKEADPYRWTRKAMKVLIDQQAEIAKLKSALEAHRIWHLEVEAEIKYIKECGGQTATSTESASSPYVVGERGAESFVPAAR